MTTAETDIEALHGLIYVSRAKPETIASMDESFRDILETAQRRNAEAEVTGGLLACEGWFLQVLEGARGDVLDAFRRISDDGRHDSIRVIEAGPKDERQFSRWSMCGRRLSVTDDAIVAVLEKHKAFNPDTLTPSRARALMQGIMRLQLKDDESNRVYLD